MIRFPKAQIGYSQLKFHKHVHRVRRRGAAYTLPFLIVSACMRWSIRTLTKIKFRFLGLRFGLNCHIGPGLVCADPLAVLLGDCVTLGKGVRLATETHRGTLRVSDNVEIGRFSLIDFSGDLVIEENVLMSEGVVIYTHDHGYDPRSKPTATALTIKQGAWIGSQAIILPSVNVIGKGAIIGAGAIVSKDVPDDCIYVAAPGRLIARRDR